MENIIDMIGRNLDGGTVKGLTPDGNNGPTQTTPITQSDIDANAARRASPEWQAAEKAMEQRQQQAQQRVKAMDKAGGSPALRTDPNNYQR